MKALPFACFTLCLAACLPMTAPGANQDDELQIPPGWDLSASLAFFRNLPLFDQTAFPETEGTVLCRFSEARNETKEALSFTNTYEFFRKTREGTYLHLTLQETSRTDLPDDPSDAATETVADARQDLEIVPGLPAGAAERPGISRLIAFVLDHRVALVQSEAGKLAQALNYTREGRVRPGNYVQPRVTFLGEQQTTAKIRVYGLEALLTDGSRASLPGGHSVENRVLEIAVDAAGAAQVALVPLQEAGSSSSR